MSYPGQTNLYPHAGNVQGETPSSLDSSISNAVQAANLRILSTRELHVLTLTGHLFKLVTFHRIIARCQPAGHRLPASHSPLLPMERDKTGKVSKSPVTSCCSIMTTVLMMIIGSQRACNMTRPLILFHSTSVPRVRFKALRIKIRVRHISLRNSISQLKVYLRTSCRHKPDLTKHTRNNPLRHKIRPTLFKASIPSSSAGK